MYVTWSKWQNNEKKKMPKEDLPLLVLIPEDSVCLSVDVQRLNAESTPTLYFFLELDSYSDLGQPDTKMLGHLCL